jgi:hypothetical protein
MEQTNMHPVSDPNSDRRIDSSRRRAEAEAAGEHTRQQEQARQERQDEEVQRVESADHQEAAQAPVATDPVWQRWWEIQSNFVDDPRSSVAEAHALVSGMVDRVVQQLQEQRRQLEQGWSSGRDVPTEDLRRSLQTYREFLGRLLERQPGA